MDQTPTASHLPWFATDRPITVTALCQKHASGPDQTFQPHMTVRTQNARDGLKTGTSKSAFDSYIDPPYNIFADTTVLTQIMPSCMLDAMISCVSGSKHELNGRRAGRPVLFG